jgi:hypothetical protein
VEKKSKKIFLIATVVVPFLIYCVYYYAHMFKNAPYKFVEFKSFSVQWGTSDSLINKYDSKTGDYQFINKHDSLIHMKVFLESKELKMLHDTARALGFWDWPSDERGDSTLRRHGRKPPRQIIAFNYARKSKIVVFDGSFVGDPRLKEANRHMFKNIIAVLDEEAAKQKK